MRAGRGIDQPEQHADRGGLPGPVRAQEAVHRARRHGKIKAVNRDLTAAEPLRQPGRRDCQHGLIEGSQIRAGRELGERHRAATYASRPQRKGLKDPPRQRTPARRL